MQVCREVNYAVDGDGHYTLERGVVGWEAKISLCGRRGRQLLSLRGIHK